MIKQKLGSEIDTLHFDEAWLPHAAFHEFYTDMHAIGANRPRSQDAMVFAKHSTHQLLAGPYHAAQNIVQDAQTRHQDRNHYIDTSLYHQPHSPQKAYIQSC